MTGMLSASRPSLRPISASSGPAKIGELRTQLASLFLDEKPERGNLASVLDGEGAQLPGRATATRERHDFARQHTDHVDGASRVGSHAEADAAKVSSQVVEVLAQRLVVARIDHAQRRARASLGGCAEAAPRDDRIHQPREVVGVPVRDGDGIDGAELAGQRLVDPFADVEQKTELRDVDPGREESARVTD